jgi:hypothetical protein
MKVYQRYYLVAYCSPARAGSTRARVEVVHTGDDGKERRGDAAFDFHAGAFSSGCDPETPPTFSK